MSYRTTRAFARRLDFGSPDFIWQAMVNWRAIEKLRAPEGNSVEILCDNPDGPQAIVCCGDFTGYKRLYFHGSNVHACLELASFTQDRFNEGGFRFVRTEGVSHEH